MARKDQISQYSADVIGIGVYENNAYIDPDGNAVTLDVVRTDDNQLIINDAPASREDIGLYWYEVTTPITSVKGDYEVTWSYTVSGDPRQFKYDFTVVNPQPYWDSLDSRQKQVIENIYFKVSDAFDSTVGGPYIWELPQSSFGYETIARLTVVDGMNKINYSRPKAFIPPYQFGSGAPRPIPENWYGLVEKAGFYEMLKHLARNYLEIPVPVNVQTAHLDRTKYSQQWMAMAEFEKEELESQIAMIKRAMQFGVKSRSQILAGGIFPVSYLNPARPRWPYVLSRFY